MTNRYEGDVAVIGGGISGIQASLDLAASGYKVYLVERSPSIGGVMSQLDKTFPTNDCAMCIMSPKLVEVVRHPDIELVTLSEVLDIKGSVGAFNLHLLKRARYVDMEKCIACGACTEKCPKRVDDVYNQSLVSRKAIYVPYPQAVPLKYVIDANNCLKLLKGKCGICEKKCPTGAIRYDDKDRELVLNVGSVIFASGFMTFDPSGSLIYAYDNNPDVVTSLEFERILSASGPFRGQVIRLSDRQHAKKIAWVQCVGSRDINCSKNGHCSSVCCMYAIKQAIIAKEHDPSVECTIFYMDMRTHGKGFESCYNMAKNICGVEFIRCRIHSVVPSPGEVKRQRVDYLDEVSGALLKRDFDMVVLSVGMQIDPSLRKLADKVGIDLTDGGFARTTSFSPVATQKTGIYVCGAFEGPKDIPQSVIEAGAAAMSASLNLVDKKFSKTEKISVPAERNIRGEVPRIGVFVCHCGINIGGVVDVPSVRDYARGLPFVVYVEDNMYSCSQDTQNLIAKVIQEKGLNRIIVAACSPRTHEPLFQETLVNAGLNKYMFEMVNIRNHNSWVHRHHPDHATEKARDLIRMAVAKVLDYEPLDEAMLSIDPSALVIGGGIAGMTAAKALADHNYSVFLIEEESRLGGQANHLYRTAKGDLIRESVSHLVKEVMAHPRIRVHLNTHLKGVHGFVGNFDSVIEGNGRRETLHHGVAVIATGGMELKPDEYLFGKDARVLTGQDLDRKLADSPHVFRTVQSAVFIQCVGSREPHRPYCSRICCTHSIASAIHLKEQNPDMRVYVLYRDIRTYGEKEHLYQKARMAGVIFIRFEMNQKPKVRENEGKLCIEIDDHVLRRPLLIHADLVILASAVIPPRNESISRFFKIPINDEGFFVERHVKLAPSDMAVDGVFLCGLAHYPKPIDESIAQAQAAAASAVKLLAKKQINTIGTVARVNTFRCSGCSVCLLVCPFNAPSLKEEGRDKGKSEINPVLCKGCGACVSSCRSGAIHLKGFDDSQIMAMIRNCA